MPVKDGAVAGHLGDDAGNRPRVDRRCVRVGAQQYLGSAVPQRDHLCVRVCVRVCVWRCEGVEGVRVSICKFSCSSV